MRVLKKDLRGEEGEIALLPESLDDLWHLRHLVERGDLVFALSQRKVPAIADKARPEKMERKTVRLGVKIEDVEFHMYSNWLRLHGRIVSGMDVGSYHTLNIEVGTDLSILKYHWRPDLLARIDDAVKESQRPKVVLALVEEGEATIGLLRQFGVQMAAEIRMSSGKGSGEDTRASFMRGVAEAIDNAAGGGADVILAGPGFAKDDLKKVIDSSYPDLAGRIAMDDASSIGRSGFQEVLRRGAVKSVLESSRIAREAKLIEELFREIATGGKAAYGIAEVQKAMKTEGRQGSLRSPTPALLKGLIRCGHCGTSMGATFATKGGKRYRYYLCQRASKSGYDACPLRTVPAGDVENAVLMQMRRALQSPEVIVETCRRAARLEQEELKTLRERLKELDIELEPLRAAAERFKRGGNGKTESDDELAEIELKIAALDQERCQAAAELLWREDHPMTESGLASELARFDGIWEELFPAERVRITRLLVESVTVTEQGIDLALRADGIGGLVAEIKGVTRQHDRRV